MLRAIFFDFNGVIVDDEAIHFELLKRVLGEEGLRLSEDEYFDDFVGFDDQGCFSEALRRAGRDVDESLIMRLIARKASYYQELVEAQGYKFFPGAIELVRAAAADRLTLAVVSGALRREIGDALRQAGVRDFFKSIVAAEDVVAGKPSPEGYLKAMQELNSQSPLPERLFHPHEILAIEDTPPGLEAASAAGLVTLAVGHTFSQSQLAMANVSTADLDGFTMERLQRRFAEASRR